MAGRVRTWWGEKFLDVLSTCMDSGRLRRGRAYSGPGRLLKFDIDGHAVKARVRGNVNPYFGVYKEPRYRVAVSLRRFSAKQWNGITGDMGRNAALLSQLLLNEMPADIERIFSARNLRLLPGERSDLVSECSCPDYASPCKHVAGVYYRIASLLDRDPFLLFQLRGMRFDRLHEALSASDLGQALIDRMGTADFELEYHACRYPAPVRETEEPADLKSFWQGAEPLPEVDDLPEGPAAPAILIRKGGDFQGFWDHGKSVIEMMEPVYDRIVKKNRDSI
ncbi:MAG: hypothetical protein F4Z52_08420 [Gammaproteobacteria bacterium]|nr:hypothetical protein [Gammaproteobacteria bacterium]